MLNFKLWLENLEFPHGRTETPASNSVILKSLQPQVDIQEPAGRSAAEDDKVHAIDGDLQRVYTKLQGADETKEPKLANLKNLFQELLDKWSEVKQTTNNTSNQRMGLGSFAPSPETIEMMQRNQPLPELKKPSGIKYYW